MVQVELLSGPHDGKKVESSYGEKFVYVPNPTARYVVRDVFADYTEADWDKGYSPSIHYTVGGNGDAV